MNGLNNGSWARGKSVLVTGGTPRSSVAKLHAEIARILALPELRERLVNEGALVKAGQQIAEMGRSGAARDMLHFEIRYNGKPVDPLQYLPRR